MSKRYAIFFAPARGSRFWTKGSAWLGRDADTGRPVAQPRVPTVADGMPAMTSNARRYGFHATLKAPMPLQAASTKEDLVADVEAFANETAPVDTGPMDINLLGGFLAIVPRKQSARLTGFASDIVSRFDQHRAALSDTERNRRMAAGLTPRQVELLERYGYPHVLEEWKLHMTLSDRLSQQDRPAMIAAARAYFAPELETFTRIDRISVFEEPSPGGAMVRIADFALKG